MQAKQVRRYQNSYLETFTYKTSDEKMESIENGYVLRFFWLILEMLTFGMWMLGWNLECGI